MIMIDIENRIKNILPKQPLTNEEIKNVEESLSVVFPDIFIKLNQYCSYEYASSFDFFYFGSNLEDNFGVISATLGVRQYCNKPLSGLVVLYTDDAGIIFLNTADENASVMWCSIYDIENFLNGQPLTMSHDFFPTFADFFSYLLDEEEKMRAEEGQE